MTCSRSKPGFAICNHEGKPSGLIAWRLPFVTALFLLVPVGLRGADPAWRVLIEPRFMKHEVSYPIQGSQRAQLVPARFSEGDVTCMSFKEFKALGVDWKAFLQAATENASADLKKLTPEYTRDRRNVIEFATIVSESPLTAASILSPDFLKLFEETLGSKIIVVIPNRYTIYAFPVLASHYQEYTSMIYDAYHATAWPVSMEAYELSEQGLKTVGLYQTP
jgi:hypothetical protein